MSTVPVAFAEADTQTTGDIRSYAQSIRSRGNPDGAQAFEIVQDQIDAITQALGRGASFSVAAVLAAVLASGYRKTTVLTLEFSEDTTITAAAPTTEGEWPTIAANQDATGGWNISAWDTMFLGGTAELGATLPDTRYLIGFQAIDISGVLKWVKIFEQLAY